MVLRHTHIRAKWKNAQFWKLYGYYRFDNAIFVAARFGGSVVRVTDSRRTFPPPILSRIINGRLCKLLCERYDKCARKKKRMYKSVQYWGEKLECIVEWKILVTVISSSFFVLLSFAVLSHGWWMYVIGEIRWRSWNVCVYFVFVDGTEECFRTHQR